MSQPQKKERATLNLSTFANTAKNYALNATASNEDFLNDLLWPYAEKTGVKHRDGDEFHLNKSQVSRLLNGRMDVPEKLRGSLGLYGLEDAITSLLEDVLEELMDLERFPAFANEVIALCSGSQAEARSRLEAVAVNPPRFMAIALMEVVKASNVNALKGKLCSRGTGSVWVEAGNLLDVGFGHRSKKAPKPIVIIPVDTGFRTHVTRGYEQEACPAVSDTALHGQWLTRMLQSDKDLSEDLLAKRIDDSLALHAGDGVKKGAGWPIGTVAIVETGSAVFYLLAISEFDENNNAHATRDEVRGAIRALIAFYDRNGQGHDLYIPLMGTGLSRAGLSSRDAYEMLVCELCADDVLIAGRAVITVLPEVAADVGLTE